MDISSAGTSNILSAEPRLVLKSRLDELDTLSQWVHSLSHRCGLAAADQFRLDLVLAEAVTNIMQNAYTDEAEHDIAVISHQQGDRLQIQIRDDGVPFDPLQHPDFVGPETLADAQVGGLGIHFIRHYTNECRYHRDNDANVLTLIFHLAAQ